MTVKQEQELYAFRRHLRRCQFYGPGGREVRSDRCNCPFHVDGTYRGERVRKGLGTSSRQLADRRLRERVKNIDARHAAESGMANSTAPADSHTVYDALGSLGPVSENARRDQRRRKVSG